MINLVKNYDLQNIKLKFEYLVEGNFILIPESKLLVFKKKL